MNREIPIFFTIDDAYAPFLAVALRSAIAHASPDRHYGKKLTYAFEDTDIAGWKEAL